MAQLNRTVFEVNTLLDQLTELLESGTEIPGLAKSIRGLSSPNLATESKVSGEILRAASAMGIGVCNYNTTETDAIVGEAQSIFTIEYLSKANRICAISADDGMLYRDWVDAASPFPAWRNREYMCNADNTPISGKMYLMNNNGHYILYLYDGSMEKLIDFDEIKNAVADMPKIKIFGDVLGIKAGQDITDKIGRPTDEWFSKPNSYVFFANFDAIGQVPISVYCEGTNLTITYINPDGVLHQIQAEFSEYASDAICTVTEVNERDLLGRPLLIE